MKATRRSVIPRWFIITLVLSIIFVFSTFYIDINNPLIYLRYFIGFIFIIYIPGFTAVKYFLDENRYSEEELVVIRIGVSICIVPVSSLIINYIFNGLNMYYLFYIIIFITYFFSILSLVRKSKRNT